MGKNDDLRQNSVRRSLTVAVLCCMLAAAALLAQQAPAGDAAQGKAIVEGKGACLTCHRIRDTGSRLGPDLTDVGATGRSREELERSLLEPDAEILPQNRFYRIVTRNGETITGRLLDHDTYSVRLIDPKERLLSFQKSELREHGFVKSSPMPSYRGKLSPQELANVVAYLASLKGIPKQ